MSFNLKDILNEESNVPTSLSTAICAASGGGKSYAVGTLGVRTLHLYGKGEAHAAESSRKMGGQNIVPVCWDGNDRTPDQAYKLILQLLEPQALEALKVKAVCIDGLTELEALIHNTEEFAARVGTNKYQRVDETINMAKAVVLKLLTARKKLGIHALMTCILDEKERDSEGYIVDCEPKVVGYRTAVTIIQMFADKILVGATSEDGRRIQFGGRIDKAQKNAAQRRMKFTNWACAIGGMSDPELFEQLDDRMSMEVDLAKLARMKAGVKEP